MPWWRNLTRLHLWPLRLSWPQITSITEVQTPETMQLGQAMLKDVERQRYTRSLTFRSLSLPPRPVSLQELLCCICQKELLQKESHWVTFRFFTKPLRQHRPMPVSEASTSTTKGLDGWRCFKIGADGNTSLRCWNQKFALCVLKMKSLGSYL